MTRWLGGSRFCGERDLEPGQAALAWISHLPGVLGPIVGPRTMAQLVSSLGALVVTFDADTVHGIDAIFPGPGGAAPEAYAW